MSFGKTRVQVLKEVSRKLRDGETLCLQQVYYDYGDGQGDAAFRFIRRDSTGRLKAQRGQAALPNLSLVTEMATELSKVAMQIS